MVLVALAVVYAVGLILIYTWVYLLTFGGLVFFYYKLCRLLTKQYCLTRRSAIALFLGGGIISWVLTIVFCLRSSLPPFLSFFLGPALFSTFGYALVATWGGLKKGLHYSVIKRLDSEVQKLKNREKDLVQRIQKLDQEIANLKIKYGNRLKQQEELRERIAAVIAQDPRALSLKKQEWESEIAGLRQAELVSELRKARQREESTTPLAQLWQLLLENELFRRQMGRVERNFEELQRRRTELEVLLQRTRAESERISAERARQASNYHRLLRTRIKL